MQELYPSSHQDSVNEPRPLTLAIIRQFARVYTPAALLGTAYLLN